MEGQAEVDTKAGKACKAQLTGMAPVCCSEKNVTGCCPDTHSHGNTYPCHPYNTNSSFYPTGRTNMDPCPHDEVQGPTNDKCEAACNAKVPSRCDNLLCLLSLSLSPCLVDAGYLNGTLVYQLKDPRTKAMFAKCWDGVANTTDGMPRSWSTLGRVKFWQNEGVGELNHVPTPAASVCPKGYCPVAASDPENKSNKIEIPCSTDYPLGGCGAWGNMTVG